MMMSIVTSVGGMGTGRVERKVIEPDGSIGRRRRGWWARDDCMKEVEVAWLGSMAPVEAYCTLHDILFTPSWAS